MQDGDVPFQRVAVVGLGLIGGSLCLALRRSFPKMALIGVDTPQVIAGAGEKLDGAFAADDLDKALHDVDLVILATPIGAILEYLPRVASLVNSTALVTDVGSTKVQIVEMAQRVMAGGGHFIGGHPMTGSEHSGWSHADAALFENAAYVLTPASRPVPEAIFNNFTRLLKEIGARVVQMNAETHDRLVAEVSHLPQLLSVALTNYAGRDDGEQPLRLQLAAGGFRDMTRLASSPFHVWRDILLTNESAIRKSLQDFRMAIGELEALLDDDEMRVKFEAAKAIKEQIEK
jgi:prephenate dehydrogenase